MRRQRVGRSFVICVMMFILASCGFTPVYSPESQTGLKLSDIRIADPGGHNDYIFVQKIEERLGHNPNAGTVLNYNISVVDNGLGLYGATRSNITGDVSYQLVSRNSKDEVIATGFVKSFVGYSPPFTLYESVQRDARERLMKILADKVVTDLMVKL